MKDLNEAGETNLPESDEFNDVASLQSGAYSGAPAVSTRCSKSEKLVEKGRLLGHV